MLQNLQIQNFALIEKLEIDFETGFSVITGETGAGKSILLGAIGLLLGQRAETRYIRKGANRCIIEARFTIDGIDRIKSFFEKNDLEYDAEACLLRRELSASGKSRAFINDTPVSLPLMRELGEQLIDIHSQHQNLLIREKGYQLYVLDEIAQNQSLLTEYQNIYRSYKETHSELMQQREDLAKSRADEDYLTFQLQQIQEGNFVRGEEEGLKNEVNRLTHAEEIKNALYKAAHLFEADEDGILLQLKEAARTLQDLARIYPIEDIAGRIESSYIELKDLANDLDNQSESVEYNPERLEQISNRLNLLYTLEQKHRVDSLDELLDVAESFQNRLNSLSHSEEHILQLEKKEQELYVRLLVCASELTQSRTHKALLFEKEVISMLSPLGMPNVRFKVEITPLSAPDSSGMDSIRFLFTANKNAELQEIASVASGGEIARVMLVLKAMLAHVTRMPTLILDEIDTGVSGEIADRMTQMMQQMGQTMQILSITHLPQMAAGGRKHYYVYKTDGEETTNSHIRCLDSHERINELARMLSGSSITEAALTNAQELLKEYGTE